MRGLDALPFDRRQFLRRWARGGLLTALTAAGAALVVRGQICDRGGLCGSCAELARCPLPPAVDFRSAQPSRLP